MTYYYECDRCQTVVRLITRVDSHPCPRCSGLCVPTRTPDPDRRWAAAAVAKEQVDAAWRGKTPE